MEKLLTQMQTNYDSMTNLLSEATVTPDTIDKPLAMLSQKTCRFRDKRSEIQGLFVAVTKLDVSMNSLVMRGKSLVDMLDLGQEVLRLGLWLHRRLHQQLPARSLRQLRKLARRRQRSKRPRQSQRVRSPRRLLESQAF